MSFWKIVTSYKYSVLLTLFGALGLLAAFMVSSDVLHIAKNPDYQPSCSVNVWVNCAPVMKSAYATMFGFPNSWLGLMGWPMSILFAFYIATHRTYSRVFVWTCFSLVAAAFVLSYIWLYIAFILLEAVCLWCVLSAFATTMYASVFVRFLQTYGFWKRFPLQTLKEWFAAELSWLVLWMAIMYYGIFG